MASPLARRLRLTPTDAEKRLWSRLRKKQLDGLRFRRQQPLGPYVVDFFCPEAKLIIEVDGGQHGEDSDARTNWLRARRAKPASCVTQKSAHSRADYRVIRFWNNDVLANAEGVVLSILEALRA